MYKISIITATYNSAKTLEQTISSVIEQDYSNVEYIIVDGKSTDGTIDIIKKYEKYGIKWISEEDSGLYEALNKGLQLATGDYFQILGSDDSLYSKDTMSKIVSQIDDDIDILSAAVMVVDEKTKMNYPIYNYHARNKKEYYGGMIPHPGMFTKLSLGRKFKFDTKYKIASDYKFFLQCYYDDNVKFKFVDDFVVFFANEGLSSDSAAFHREDNLIYKELNLPFTDSPISSKNEWKRNLKIILHKVHILEPLIELKNWLDVRMKSEEHHCDNKICRWCGRM